MAKKKTVVCEEEWSCEPRLVLNKKYEWVRSYWRNGEGHHIKREEMGLEPHPIHPEAYEACKEEEL